MIRTTFLVAALGLGTALAARAQAPAGAAPAISFGEQGVAVSGLPPQGRAVLFGIAREIREGVSTVVRREAVLADDDGDGTALLALDRAVPAASVWVAVALGPGQIAVAAPADSPFRVVAPPEDSVRRGGAGLADRLEMEGSYLETLLVRPGEGPSQGAWGLTAGNGAAGDEDGASDDRIRSSPEHMAPLGNSPAPPRQLADGDVLVVVDPNRMELFAVRLDLRGK